MEFVVDSLSPELKTQGQTVLLIGSKYSSFLDYNKLRQDSTYDAMVKNHANMTEIIAKGMAIGRLARFALVF